MVLLELRRQQDPPAFVAVILRHRPDLLTQNRYHLQGVVKLGRL